MDYFCEDCNKTSKTNYKRKLLQSLAQNQSEKRIRTKHNIQIPDFFDATSMFHEFISNHNKQFEV